MKRNLLHIRNQFLPRSKHHQGYKNQPVYDVQVRSKSRCPEIITKHTTQSEHHVEFFNVKPGGT
jgi:hypothetical protein